MGGRTGTACGAATLLETQWLKLPCSGHPGRCPCPPHPPLPSGGSHCANGTTTEVRITEGGAGAWWGDEAEVTRHPHDLLVSASPSSLPAGDSWVTSYSWTTFRLLF